MTSKIIRKVAESCKFANVCTALSVIVDGNNHVPHATILSALTKTVEAIPALTYVINDNVQSGGYKSYEYRSICLEDSLKYVVEAGNLPTKEAVALQLVEESRRPADMAKSLFALKAVHYSDGIMIYFVVNHSIVDGPSIFKVADVFLQFLTAQIDEAFIVTVRPTIDRDVIGEVLANPLSKTKPEENSLLNTPQSNMLKFPNLTDLNTDTANNGCMRVVYRELSEETTSNILRNCRKFGVSFQSLLSSATALAFIKLLHSNCGSSDALWNAPIIQMTNANMRRFLADKEEEPADAIVDMGAAFLRWKMQPLESPAALAARRFWSDFVYADAQKPIREFLDSPELLQSVFGGEHGAYPYEEQTYSLHSTSLGSLTAVQKRYGAITVGDIHMHAGIWSHTQEQFDHPAVPAALINSGAPGFALVHVYTVFGKLKLTGEYFAYSEQFITPYYEELMQILVAAGSEVGSVETVTVGELFTLE